MATHGSHTSTLPPELSRSRLIRTLSVFVSQLESISDPGEPNYDICVQASKAISRTLDELLNLSPSHLDYACTASSQLTNLGIDNSRMTVSDAVNADVWDEFHLPNWANSIEWNTMCGEWSMS